MSQFIYVNEKGFELPTTTGSGGWLVGLDSVDRPLCSSDKTLAAKLSPSDVAAWRKRLLAMGLSFEVVEDCPECERLRAMILRHAAIIKHEESRVAACECDTSVGMYPCESCAEAMLFGDLRKYLKDIGG